MKKRKVSLLKLFAGYTQTYWRTALLCTALPGIFLLVEVLSPMPSPSVRYALHLCTVLLSITLILSFFQYAKRQLSVWQALQTLPPDPETIPPAYTPEKKALRQLAIAYGQQFARQADAVFQSDQERLDYYTLWVHQIKTPIAALHLIAQSEQPVDRQLLKQEIFKIEQYADAALSYQRLNSIRSDLHITEVPLYPLCCKVARKLRPMFSFRSISLCMELFECSAITDSKWLSMVLEQVLTNALKYTPEGGQITIACDLPQILTVTDTGIGIRPEDVPRVFDRGFTGYTGRNSEKSTGIGLYLCKQAMDLLGHTIQLTSVPNEGTCCTLNLYRNEWMDF